VHRQQRCTCGAYLLNYECAGVAFSVFSRTGLNCVWTAQQPSALSLQLKLRQFRFMESFLCARPFRRDLRRDLHFVIKLIGARTLPSAHNNTAIGIFSRANEGFSLFWGNSPQRGRS
jgi:hypothetical protein